MDMSREYAVDYYEVHSNIIAVNKYWGDQMPIMCMEELAELIQAISKRERYCMSATDGLKNEIADVYISLYAIMSHYDIDASEITELMNKKLKKKYGNKEKLMEFLCDCGVGIRGYNALLRNDINSIEKLIYIVRSKKAWYKDIKGLGKTNAEKIESIVLEHCTGFLEDRYGQNFLNGADSQ